jgi:hypothetical protein
MRGGAGGDAPLPPAALAAAVPLGGVAARAVPPPGRPPVSRRWYWRLREVPALPYDAALMAWARLRGRG